MASVFTNGKNGTRSIAVVVGKGKRRIIRLGKVSMKQATSAKGFIEDIVACKLTGTAPRNTTAEWLAALSDTFYGRLEKAGLVGPRGEVMSITLGTWLDTYINGRTDVKERTRINFLQASGQLIEYFSHDKPLDRITPGDADGFNVWVRTEKKLSEGTARRRVKRCKQFFAAAIRKRLISENPFSHIKCGNFAEDRFYFVSREETQAVLDACPDAEWRLIFALARFAGLRVPSEILPLTWDDVNWEKNRFIVHSPKTAHHNGKGARVVPIFPELFPYLRDSFEQAKPGQVHLMTRHRSSNTNLRTHLLRIIGRAGLSPWPKLFVNLRSTRETELVEEFPMHVVTAWLGNSPDIARKHYLQLTEEHFERAVGGAEKSAAKPAAHATNPDLTAVMNAWDKLPASIKRLIQEVAAGKPSLAK